MVLVRHRLPRAQWLASDGHSAPTVSSLALLDYEQLVRQPAAVLGRLASFMGDVPLRDRAALTRLELPSSNVARLDPDILARIDDGLGRP